MSEFSYCKQCGKWISPERVYCGAACCAEFESHRPPDLARIRAEAREAALEEAIKTIRALVRKRGREDYLCDAGDCVSALLELKKEPRR